MKEERGVDQLEEEVHHRAAAEKESKSSSRRSGDPFCTSGISSRLQLQ